MANLTADRVMFGEELIGQTRKYKAAANAVAFRGSLAAINANGYAVRASDTAGLIVKGTCTEAIDNTGGADGDLEMQVRRGERCYFGTTGANAITQADVGDDAYVLDDQTVVRAAGTSNNVVAGEVLAVETVGGVVRVTLKVGDE